MGSIGKLPQEDRNAKVATANLSYTKIGLTPKIMNSINQEILVSVTRRQYLKILFSGFIELCALRYLAAQAVWSEAN